MVWRVARSLDVLLKQLNTLAPNRSKKSDGSIGDAAHATRSSDHNPWLSVGGTGVVTARDFTNDPAGGLDCNWLAQALIDSHDPRIKYLIWNRRIYTPGYGWAAYKGPNPHDHHLHLSVASSIDLFDLMTPWKLSAQVKSPASPKPTPTVPEDWFDMATREELTEVVTAVIANEMPKVLRTEGVSGAGDWGTEQRPDGTWPIGATAKRIVVEGTTESLRTEGVSGAGDTGRLVAAIMAELPTDGSYVSKADVEAAAERGLRNMLRAGVDG